jgi:hypothetical protein
LPSSEPHTDVCADPKYTVLVSIDGLIGRETQTLMKKLSAMLAEKWEKPYAEVCGYITAWMSIVAISLLG